MQRVKIPLHAPALVRELYSILRDQRLSLNRASQLAGLGQGSIANWGSTHVPGLLNFEAALNAVGYRLKIERIEDD